MKRLTALLLSGILLLTGCAGNDSSSVVLESSSQSTTTTTTTATTTTQTTTTAQSTQDTTTVPEFAGMNDPALLGYIEDAVYTDLVTELNSTEYFVENVSTLYYSQEYLDAVAFNTQKNIYFGYTLEELHEQFQGSRFVFTLGENGETTVKEFEAYDDTYEQVLRNVAVGTGVILVCVTVSVVSAGAGAPAVSLIFAASAKAGLIGGVSGGLIGGLSAGVVTGLQTKDFDAALKSAALSGSEVFKWGAICGAIAGGSAQAVALKGATLNGLTMNQAAQIQKQSRYPLDVIKQFKSIEQYNICKKAGLTPQMINGKTALIRNIDLNFVDDLGRTNLERMAQGIAALDPNTGQAYQLHHIGQKADSTLAILTEAEHKQGGNYKIWHELGKTSEVHGTPELDNIWNTQYHNFWVAMAELLS